MEELYIVNYYNPGCLPLKSITRLPEAEAFKMAETLAAENKGTAFGRFADFVNYYPKRIRTEKWLYECFLKNGGEPENEHPLYFVLNSSKYLHEWFGSGEAIKLPLSQINEKHISFTLSDSMALIDAKERREPITLGSLYSLISEYRDLTIFFNEVEKRWHYIEVQLWKNDYLV